MTPQELFARFRNDVVDTEEPFLWTDNEVLGYMNDAQQMLVRLTGGIRDASSSVTQVPITDGDPWVDLDESILRIRSATLQSTKQPVKILSYEEKVPQIDPISSWPTEWVAATNEMWLDGPVRFALIGMEEGKLRLVRQPVEDDTLLLIVERLPLISLQVAEPTDLPDEFEVRKEHHLALLKWMKYLAYSKQDSETFDKVRSAEAKQDFLTYCATALDEKERRNHKPRQIVYGGL